MPRLSCTLSHGAGWRKGQNDGPTGGVAVIKVGGTSEVEVGEKKDRYDDDNSSTLPGGGVALLKASLQLATNSPGSGTGSASSPISPDMKPIHTLNFDQELGVAIIRRTLRR